MTFSTADHQIFRTSKDLEKLRGGFDAWTLQREQLRESLYRRLTAPDERQRTAAEKELQKLDEEDVEEASEEIFRKYRGSTMCHRPAYVALGYRLAIAAAEERLRMAEEVRGGEPPIQMLEPEDGTGSDDLSRSSALSRHSIHNCKLDALLSSRGLSRSIRDLSEEVHSHPQTHRDFSEATPWIAKWGLHGVGCSRFEVLHRREHHIEPVNNPPPRLGLTPHPPAEANLVREASVDDILDMSNHPPLPPSTMHSRASSVHIRAPSNVGHACSVIHIPRDDTDVRHSPLLEVVHGITEPTVVDPIRSQRTSGHVIHSPLFDAVHGPAGFKASPILSPRASDTDNIVRTSLFDAVHSPRNQLEQELAANIENEGVYSRHFETAHPPTVHASAALDNEQLARSPLFEAVHGSNATSIVRTAPNETLYRSPRSVLGPVVGSPRGSVLGRSFVERSVLGTPARSIHRVLVSPHEREMGMFPPSPATIAAAAAELASRKA